MRRHKTVFAEADDGAAAAAAAEADDGAASDDADGAGGGAADDAKKAADALQKSLAAFGPNRVVKMFRHSTDGTTCFSPVTAENICDKVLKQKRLSWPPLSLVMPQDGPILTLGDHSVEVLVGADGPDAAGTVAVEVAVNVAKR